MKVIGFAGHDATFSPAIYRGRSLRSEIIPKLAAWLIKQRYREPP